MKPTIPVARITKSAWEEVAGWSWKELAGGVLCPDATKAGQDTLIEWMTDYKVGSVFMGSMSPQEWREKTRAVSGESLRPVLVASDFEHGAGCMVQGGATDFPWAMAAGACDDVDLMEEMGRVTAREGRFYGAHLTLGPQVDLQWNPENPVVNVRAMGADPGRVARLGSAWIRGLQEEGLMAACAKHFPGDGVDDRDQHLCTSVNPLDWDTWNRTFGRVWREVITAGTRVIMAGHIAFPAWSRKVREKPDDLPGTLSRAQQVKLLRRELGFEGVIISDALVMGGICSRVPSQLRAVENLRAGSDMVLFSEPRRDIPAILDALERGHLDEKALRVSAARILELKRWLGLGRAKRIPPPMGRAAARSAARMAAGSITVVRSSGALLTPPRPGTALCLAEVTYPESPPALRADFSVLEEHLKAEGFKVIRLQNPSPEALREAAGTCERVYVCIAIVPHSCLGTIRATGPAVRPFWESWWTDSDRAVFTSFGNPYLLREFPHLPNLVLAYGISPVSQKACARVWLGKRKALGKCPVDPLRGDMGRCQSAGVPRK